MNGDHPPAVGRPVVAGWPWLVVVGSALLGLILIVEQADRLSATYDEVTYLQVAARWWRTGEQESISRMGTPLTFWKIQQAPTLAWIDHFGDRSWIDDPIAHQARLLPWVRIGGVWIWLVALGVVALWARTWYGDQAMAAAAALFALSPNLLAHGALATMEMPLVATSAAMLFAFTRFLDTGRQTWFGLAASLGGLAFSCKFTTIVLPPLFAIVWGVHLWRHRDRSRSIVAEVGPVVRTVGWGMLRFGGVMALANLLLTGGAMIPLSPRTGAHPLLVNHLGPTSARCLATIVEWSFPQDWVGFATQVVHQTTGGPSYLLGERRCSGWWYYYPITLAVKVPLAVWLLAVVRLVVRPRDDPRGWIVPLYVGLFVLVAVLGSKRNYGVRYLLPLAPAAIVWISATANSAGRLRGAVPLGVAGMALAVGSIHPYELSYFNAFAGGAEGGRYILSDSNLDWGQGAKAVAQLQADCPEFRDLTWYAFGDTDPAHYGVVGRRYRFDAHRPPTDLPARLAASTRFLAVSASLQWGPWGPAGYFRALDALRPIRYSADKTVAIYRTSDLEAARAVPVRTGRDPE